MKVPIYFSSLQKNRGTVIFLHLAMNETCKLAIGVLCLLVLCPYPVEAKGRRQNSEVRPAVAAPTFAKLKKEIESITVPGKRPDLRVGVLVVSLGNGETFYEKNADDLLIPASVSKLFTAYTALKKLRPTSTFKTTVHTKGVLQNGKLTGDLYLKGGGDPSLVSERLWMLINELVRSGIESIQGNVIADSGYFDEEKTPDSRPKYLKDQAYNAPVGALSFNFNTTTIFVKPGEIPDAKPIVYTDPENSYIDVVNQAMTGRVGSKNTVQVKRTDYVKGDIGDTVLLRGTLPIDSHEMRFYKNIVNPALYTAHMFKTFWEQRGLKLNGNILEGQVPEDAKGVLEFESLPLWQIVWGMNKFSNNFVADQILKKIGAELWGVPGTRQKGLTAIHDCLEDIGIPPKSYTISDGSGLTRNTRVTPRQITRVLTTAFKDFSISAEMMASLGVSGGDGTLKRRILSSNPENIVRAKTGSLDGVASLAGYTTTADGELVAFAILLNDPKQKYGRMTGWVDQIAQAIMSFSRR